MQELVLKNIGSFIEMDSESTVKLCDQWFRADYNQIVEAICKFCGSQENEICFSFINKVLDMRQQTIMDEYMQTVYSG